MKIGKDEEQLFHFGDLEQFQDPRIDTGEDDAASCLV
jgi:hypothetical protein